MSDKVDDVKVPVIELSLSSLLEYLCDKGKTIKLEKKYEGQVTSSRREFLELVEEAFESIIKCDNPTHFVVFGHDDALKFDMSKMKFSEDKIPPDVKLSLPYQDSKLKGVPGAIMKIGENQSFNLYEDGSYKYAGINAVDGMTAAVADMKLFHTNYLSK